MIEEFSRPWILLGTLAGFGVAAYQVRTGTYSRKRRGDGYLTTFRRTEEPVRWFASTLGWFIAGLIFLALFLGPRLADGHWRRH